MFSNVSPLFSSITQRFRHIVMSRLKVKIIKMRAALFIFLLILASKAKCNNYLNTTVRCSNNSQTSLTFEPSEDNIDGRYKVEWCTKAEKDDIKWELILEYLDSKTPSKCHDYTIPPKGKSHSSFELPVTINLNCTLVCFSTLLDLVFDNTCYHIKTVLQNKNPTKIGKSNDSFHYITNNFPKEHFTNSGALVSTEINDDGSVLLKWYLGYVPATLFSVSVRDNQTIKQSYDTSCKVSGASLSEVSCNANLPAGLCYEAELRHHSYWTVAPSLFGYITNIAYSFCVRVPDVAKASSSPWGEFNLALGAAAIVLSALAVLCAVRRRRLAALQRRVRDRWLETSRTEPTERAGVEGDILLLYARDCETFKRAAERLGALVHRVTGRRVIDVYSGESTRLWAPAGDEWLRLMLARDDTRVLLLQSPAGALLAANLAESRSGPALVAPLLGSLVSWRRPHAGDALLSLALRQLTAAPHHEPYKKHYVANISGLGADMAAGVTPQRRYTLPDAMSCLLRDLAPDLKLALGLDAKPGLESAPKLVLAPVLDLERRDLEPLLRQFKDAADAFTDHVRDHPDYLADELLFK